MMLSYQSIAQKIAEGEISIVPYNHLNIGPASYDLTLGNSFIEVRPEVTNVEICTSDSIPPQFRGVSGGSIPTRKKVRVRSMDEGYPEHKIEVSEGKGIILPPKGFVLATTEEYIKASPKYALYVEGRSSIGRMGLQVQNAGFVDPGFEGQITLELFNASDVPIALKPGRRICQITIIELDEPTQKPYNGKYMGQTGAVSSRIEEDREAVPPSPKVHLL